LSLKYGNFGPSFPKRSFVQALAPPKNGDEQSYESKLYSSNEVGQNAVKNVHPRYSMK